MHCQWIASFYKYLSTINMYLFTFSSMVLFLYVTSSQRKIIFREEIAHAGISFGVVSKVLDVPNAVTYISEDQFLAGNILYATSSQLISTNGYTNLPIVGDVRQTGNSDGTAEDARFFIITAYVHLNKSHLVVVDSLNHCLRMVNRESRVSSTLVGLCGLRGKQDGSFELARLGEGLDLVKGREFYQQRLYFLEKFSGITTIKIINLQTRMVETLLSSTYLRQATYLILPVKLNDLLYIFADPNVTKFQLGAENKPPLPNLFTLPSLKNDDGPFAQAGVNSFERILELSDGIFIQSGAFFYRNRVIDVPSEIVSSICTRTGTDFIPGPISKCNIPNMAAIGIVNNTIYFGTHQHLHKLPIKFLCTDPKPTIENGFWTGTNSSIKYECQRGYEMLSGDKELKCSAKRKWEGTIPVCTKLVYRCPNPPPSIDNGEYLGDNVSVTYQCSEGYSISAGDRELFCNSDSVWDGQPPKCIRAWSAESGVCVALPGKVGNHLNCIEAFILVISLIVLGVLMLVGLIFGCHKRRERIKKANMERESQSLSDSDGRKSKTLSHRKSSVSLEYQARKALSNKSWRQRVRRHTDDSGRISLPSSPYPGRRSIPHTSYSGGYSH